MKLMAFNNARTVPRRIPLELKAYDMYNIVNFKLEVALELWVLGLLQYM